MADTDRESCADVVLERWEATPAKKPKKGEAVEAPIPVFWLRITEDDVKALSRGELPEAVREAARRIQE